MQKIKIGEINMNIEQQLYNAAVDLIKKDTHLAGVVQQPCTQNQVRY